MGLNTPNVTCVPNPPLTHVSKKFSCFFRNRALHKATCYMQHQPFIKKKCDLSSGLNFCYQTFDGLRINLYFFLGVTISFGGSSGHTQSQIKEKSVWGGEDGTLYLGDLKLPVYICISEVRKTHTENHVYVQHLNQIKVQ